MDNTFFFYTKDLSKVKVGDEFVTNPVPRRLRQRRQVVAAVLKNGILRFGKVECSHKDVFIKKVGRMKAKGIALSSSPSFTAPIHDTVDRKEIGRLFVKMAQDMITPGPELVEHVKTVTRYTKAKHGF